MDEFDFLKNKILHTKRGKKKTLKPKTQKSTSSFSPKVKQIWVKKEDIVTFQNKSLIMIKDVSLDSVRNLDPRKPLGAFTFTQVIASQPRTFFYCFIFCSKAMLCLEVLFSFRISCQYFFVSLRVDFLFRGCFSQRSSPVFLLKIHLVQA